jgi:deoxycytidylate deaminase
MKLLVAYGIKEIYYFRRYRDDLKSFELAEEAGIKMVHVPEFSQIIIPEVVNV